MKTMFTRSGTWKSSSRPVGNSDRTIELLETVVGTFVIFDLYMRRTTSSYICKYIYNVCIYSYSHEDIHTKSLSLSLFIYRYLYLLYTYCWNTIQIFHVPNPQKNPPSLFRGFSCVSRCSSGPHAFVRRRWKPLRLENCDPWRFLVQIANWAVFGLFRLGFRSLGGFSLNWESLWYGGSQKQPTTNS